MKDQTSRRKAAPSPLLLVLFVVTWFALCAAAFWYIYSDLLKRTTDSAASIAALQWMTWPFAVVALGGPLVVVVALGGTRVVRDLLDMRKLIEALPDQVLQMESTLTAFQELRAKLLTDQIRASLDSQDPSPSAPADQEQNEEEQPAHIKEFWPLYDEAKKYLYRALEAYNAQAKEPLVIQRGGSNFHTVAAQLAEVPNIYDPNPSKNKRIAEFVRETISEEKNTRRWRLQTLKPERVRELTRMKP
jgi:hypothetical protein